MYQVSGDEYKKICEGKGGKVIHQFPNLINPDTNKNPN